MFLTLEHVIFQLCKGLSDQVEKESLQDHLVSKWVIASILENGFEAPSR